MRRLQQSVYRSLSTTLYVLLRSSRFHNHVGSAARAELLQGIALAQADFQPAAGAQIGDELSHRHIRIGAAHEGRGNTANYHHRGPHVALGKVRGPDAGYQVAEAIGCQHFSMDFVTHLAGFGYREPLKRADCTAHHVESGAVGEVCRHGRENVAAVKGGRDLDTMIGWPVQRYRLPDLGHTEHQLKQPVVRPDKDAQISEHGYGQPAGAHPRIHDGNMDGAGGKGRHGGLQGKGTFQDILRRNVVGNVYHPRMRGDAENDALHLRGVGAARAEIRSERDNGPYSHGGIEPEVLPAIIVQRALRISDAVKTGIIAKYRDFLPPAEDADIVSLCEGDTPLVHAPRLANAISPNIDLYLKLEGLNPTGSFKDRGMTLAVTMARADGRDTVMCASTGNTSASAAAYAARAGMRCFVLIPSGKIALGKLAQALMHGARVLAIQGNFDEALCLVREITADYPITMVNSLNPFRLEGQKTAAFEVVDALGRAPDYHALPVGNAGNITAYWMGYKEYRACGRADGKPAMLGFQAAGAAPIVRGEPVPQPETVATAIRIGNPASWKSAVAARDESGGRIEMVTDAEILEAYRLTASLEGVFAEPASVAPIAGLRKLAATGFFARRAVVVATLTGHGLKDPQTAVSEAAVSAVTVPADRGAVLKALGY